MHNIIAAKILGRRGDTSWYDQDYKISHDQGENLIYSVGTTLQQKKKIYEKKHIQKYYGICIHLREQL